MDAEYLKTLKVEQLLALITPDRTLRELRAIITEADRRRFVGRRARKRLKAALGVPDEPNRPDRYEFRDLAGPPI